MGNKRTLFYIVIIFGWLAIGLSGSNYLKAAEDDALANITNFRIATHENDVTRLVFLSDIDLKPTLIELKTVQPMVLLHVPLLNWQVNINGPQNIGAITDFRYDGTSSEQAFIQINLRYPVKIQGYLDLPPDKTHSGWRFVLNLIKVDPEAFKKQTIKLGIISSVKPSSQSTSSSVDDVSPSPTNSSQQVKSSKIASRTSPHPPPSAPTVPAEKPLIVIDPGHGGIDPGATGTTGIHEKVITLAIAKGLRDDLLRSGRYRVLLTRDDDTYIPLAERVSIAHKAKASLFISIHADLNANPSIRGLSVYTLSKKGSSLEADKLAASENKADIIPSYDYSSKDLDVTKMLINMTQNFTLNSSTVFADDLVHVLSKQTALLEDTHRTAAFAVLKGLEFPAVLIETGYLSNVEEEKELKTDTYREKLASAISKAVDIFFDHQHHMHLGKKPYHP